MKNILFFILISAQAYGQGIDYSKIILPSHVSNPDFAEKLVQLAWRNHPTNEIFRNQVKLAELEVKKSSAQWLNIITVQANLNEFNLNPDADVQNRSDFFPRYNFGARIPLGIFVEIPSQTRQSRQRVLMSQDELNAQMLETRRTVVKTYNDYILAENIYKVQFQQYSDAESAMKLIEQKFKNGELTFEAYTNSQTNFNRMAIQFMQAERDYKNTKLDLEQLIGIRLEDVM